MTIEVVTASQVVAEQAAQAKEQAEKEAAAAVQKDGAKQDVSEASEQDKEEEGKEAPEAKEGEEEESKEEPKKGPSGYKKKFLREAEARALAEREISTLKELLNKGKPEEKPTANAPADKPKSEDYGTHEEFVEALTEWKIEQKEKLAEAKRREEEAKASVKSRVDKFAQGWKSFTDAQETAAEVMDEAMAEQPMSLAVQDILLDTENGPEISYHLAKNLDEWKRINSLPPLAAARELGRFEAALSKPEKQEIKQTKAPAPIRPVGGSAAAPKEKTLKDVSAETSQAEYEAIRAKQLARKQA